MAGTVPQSVLTKYAVVRAPRAIAPDEARLSLVRRPDRRTDLWDRLEGLLHANAGSNDFETTCEAYLAANPLPRNDQYSEVFDRIRGRVAKLPASPSARFTALQTEPNLFDDGERIIDFTLFLWDQLAARLIYGDRDKLAAALVQSIVFVQLTTYAKSLGNDPVLSPSSLDPQLVMPPSLLISSRRRGGTLESPKNKQRQNRLIELRKRQRRGSRRS
jgi:hypothetical protein